MPKNGSIEKHKLVVLGRSAMSYEIQKKFYSYLPLLKFYAKIAIGCSGIFLVAAVIGQWYSGRLPAYGDLAFALLIPLAAFIIMSLLTLISDYYYPLTVSDTGLKCYNIVGRYCTVSWQDIVSIEEGTRFGLQCLYVNVNGFRPPLILPLWLHDLSTFRSTIEQYATQDNALALYLTKAPQAR